ncbi:serine hydrolase domain-containing protein [Desertihabitans aurantiacus]|uniref:serine hydrolase domain-containing protein n=1 Tax=Desertihabitans aurantiacus TaxID=2282477 RepID=UPI000DF802D2|nr:serine hydrolase domain-containing protein [Desertihabitans aurantiacus]
MTPRTDADGLQRRLDDALERARTAADVPGASVAVAVGDRTVLATSGVVSTRTQVPVATDALFQIQSITKVLTATLVLQLVDEGLVGLDDPVQRHLPEFRTADPGASTRITVRHLLTHTGGFEGDLWAPTTAGPDALDRFVRDLVPTAAQHSEPGTRFSYCNAGFGTLGRLVEVHRDLDYEHALRRHLTDPLGVEEIAFSANQAVASRTATGHIRPTPEEPLRPTREWALLPPSNPAAGNQLALSARGLLAVGRLFLTRGRAADGTRLLSEASAAAMLEPQLAQRPGLAPPTTLQGLGWYLVAPGVAEHGGGMPGVASVLRVVPEAGVAVAGLTNADAGQALLEDLLGSLHEELVGPLPDQPTPSRTPPTDAHVDGCTGRYATRQSVVTVTREDGRLWLTDEPRHERLAIAEAAGVADRTTRRELRPLEAGLCAVLDDDGRPTGTVSFLDPDAAGRYRFLATHRIAPRTASPT